MALINERRENLTDRDNNGASSLSVLPVVTRGGGRPVRQTGERPRSPLAFSFGSQGLSRSGVVSPTPTRSERAEYTPSLTPVENALDSGSVESILRLSKNWRWLQGSSTPGSTYLICKRLFDVTLAMGALILLFPVLLLVGLAIFLEDGGPILYYQSRVGRDGKPFRFYKFRSMVKNADAIKDQLAALNEADGPIFKMKNDPRITRVGRLLRRSSVDELPQFINVLRGEMTLIGPRPHLPREVALYVGSQQQRLLVQPGLVCLREVHGRSNLTFDQWIELDLLYIQNRSIRTDLSILAQLIPAVLKGDGAY
jgi:lipopolysaccharide/colanic/teichoic acid biosynthesis glycosyltransferase